MNEFTKGDECDILFAVNVNITKLDDKKI